MSSSSSSAAAAATTPPPTHRALILSSPGQPLAVHTVPTPTVTPGSVLVRILACNVEANTDTMLSGKVPGLHLPPTPYTPGARAIARVAALGPDTTSLTPGQLVMLEPFVRARDNPTAVAMLWGTGVFGGDARAAALMGGCWRDGVYAEYARAPLENCHALDEAVLCGRPDAGGLGYGIAELASLGRSLVAYGGLRGIGLQAGETVIVAPATGGYSGAAVGVAVAMGARVIAVGRNLEALQKVAAVHGSRVSVVQLKGSVEEDLAALQKFGSIDAYIDISPGVASDSTHVRSCMLAVRPHGRVSLMGVIHKDIAIPYVVAVLRNLTIRGQYMYEREDVRGIIKLAEAGLLKLGKSAGHEVVAEFPLEEFEKALETANNNPEAGKVVLLRP